MIAFVPEPHGMTRGGFLNSTQKLKLTLLALHVVEGDGVFPRGQRTGEQDVGGRRRVLRVGEAGLSAPAAQRLV